MRIPFLFLIPLLSGALLAQTAAYTERELADALPDRYLVDVATLRQKIVQRIENYYPVDKWSARRNFRFADQSAYETADLLSGGFVYSDWPELVSHVEKVLQKVMPEELEGDEKVQVHIVRSGRYNAFMTPTGQMFVNIGLIAQLKDEASLAAVLCHELAHYHMDHSFHKFYNDVTGEYGGGIPGEFRMGEHAVKMELQADSLAIQWLSRSDYHIGGLLDQFRVMERLEKQWKRYRGEHKDKGPRTHPAPKERLLAFRQFYDAHKDDPGERFLVNEDRFKALQAACKPEILRVLLYGMDYTECIEQAFSYHLFEPDEPTYVWYMMEAIRRKCYLNVDYWDELFIMDQYHDATPVGGKKFVERTEDHLFKKFDLDVMCLDPSSVTQVQARFYWEGETKFTTYGEAFEFFDRLGALLECRECLLSSALWNKQNIALRDTLLTNYLSGPAKYPEFARELLNGSLRVGLSGKKLLVFSEMEAYVRLGRHDIPIRVNNGDRNAQLKRISDTLAIALEGRKVMLFQDQKRVSLERYLLLNELLQLSLFTTVAKGERTELHVLDPRFHAVFREEAVEEIEFVLCRYGEYRAKEKTVEGYEEVTNMDYGTIFDQTGGTRFFEAYVSSLREMDKSPMKVRYYGGENPLKGNDKGFPQMVSMVKGAINGKEERARLIAIYVYK